MAKPFLFKQLSSRFIPIAFFFLISSFEIQGQNIQSAMNATSGINSFTIKPDAELILYNRMIFGQFIEHFHRQIYGGIFDPGSELSDKDGFRKDVIEALRELKVPIVRWPGGCFVSSYHWLEAIGNKRTPIYDKAWKVEEPNTFETDKYISWCRRSCNTGSEAI